MSRAERVRQVIILDQAQMDGLCLDGSSATHIDHEPSEFAIGWINDWQIRGYAWSDAHESLAVEAD